MKAKRSFNPPIVLISNRYERAHSKFSWIKEDRTSLVQNFLEQSKSKPACSQRLLILKIEDVKFNNDIYTFSIY